MISYLPFSSHTGKIPIEHFAFSVTSKTTVPYTQFCASSIFPTYAHAFSSCLKGRKSNLVDCPVWDKTLICLDLYNQAHLLQSLALAV